jgi:hypothetical protein
MLNPMFSIHSGAKMAQDGLVATFKSILTNHLREDEILAVGISTHVK